MTAERPFARHPIHGDRRKPETKALKLGPVTVLDAAEANKAMVLNDRQADRPWAIWRAWVMGK